MVGISNDFPYSLCLGTPPTAGAGAAPVAGGAPAAGASAFFTGGVPFGDDDGIDGLNAEVIVIDADNSTRSAANSRAAHGILRVVVIFFNLILFRGKYLFF